MATYNMGANRTASDMDGGGTDLTSKDIVITNAFKLTLDIDCEWRKITVSNNGELQVDGHIYIIDDLATVGIEAQAGSKITGPNLTKTVTALFKSAAGIGSLPVFGPWSFSSLGSVSLKYCRAYGHKWTMRNTNFFLELPLGSTKFSFSQAANLVRNSIQGGEETIKWTGFKRDGWGLTGLLFDADVFLLDYLLEMLTSGETFSLITERFFNANVKLTNVSVNPGAQDILRFAVGVVEVV